MHGAADVQCGVAEVEQAAAVPQRRIASGMQTLAGTQPWAATVRAQGATRSFHQCGAVILSEFHVLTAAHCMEDYPRDVYRVRVGDWDMEVHEAQEQGGLSTFTVFQSIFQVFLKLLGKEGHTHTYSS